MSDDRPNVLLFMTDQQRGDCLSIDGHPVLLTPNMDHLGASGARFRRAYSTCPSCIAARRSLLSGQFPATHGMVGYHGGQVWDAPPTLPGVLQDAGYETAIVGRAMHQYAPDTHFGFKSVGSSYEKYVAQGQPVGGGGSFGHGVSGNGWTARPWHLAEHLHYTHWVVNEALDFLERRNRQRPFFLVVSFVAPHPPLVPPAFYLDRYLRLDLPPPVIGDWAEPPPNHGLGRQIESDQVHLTGEALRSCQAGYFGLINHIDDQLYRILGRNQHVDFRNTYTLFTADHGEMLGDHHLFRKCYPYEGSARIPFLINGPDVRPGLVNDEAVCLEDIMPTMLDLLGCDIPDTVDGLSLAPILTGAEQQHQREYLHGEHAACYRQEQANHFLTDGRKKYVWYGLSGEEQLFDLEADPDELTNLAAKPEGEAETARWRQRLVERLADRAEGFSDGQRLIAGRPHVALMPAST